MFQARAQALASLRSHAPVFSGMSNQDSFSAMSASRTIQAASIFYLDNLLATASALYTSSCLLFWLNSSTSTFSPITIFWICRIQAVGEALHSLLYISFPEFAGISTNSIIQPSLIWSHCVSFRLRYSPACKSSQFSTSPTFSPCTFFWFFTFHSKIKTKGSLPHQVLLFALFFCWNVNSSSFCVERAVAISIACSRWAESQRLESEIGYKAILALRQLPPGSCYHQLRPCHATSQVANFY